jgi:hypothetical protein
MYKKLESTLLVRLLLNSGYRAVRPTTEKSLGSLFCDIKYCVIHIALPAYSGCPNSLGQVEMWHYSIYPFEDMRMYRPSLCQNYLVPPSCSYIYATISADGDLLRRSEHFRPPREEPHLTKGVSCGVNPVHCTLLDQRASCVVSSRLSFEP